MWMLGGAGLAQGPGLGVSLACLFDACQIPSIHSVQVNGSSVVTL